MSDPIRNTSPYPIRMQKDLRDLLTVQAKKSERSLHAEILARLRASCDLPPPETIQEKTMRQIAREEIEKALKNNKK